MSADGLPPFGRCALLLDLDGTLLDFAPTPDAVVMPPDLPGTLARLCAALDGALAVVTGRPVDQIDALLPGIVPAVAGEHGAALRPAPGAALMRAELPALPPAVVAQAEALAAAHPGVVVERKPHGVVLHYRLAPAAGEALRAGFAPIAAAVAEHFHVVPAHYAWELRPRIADKGRAVAGIMALPGFTGRIPVFVGDDVTDEDGMAVARQMGGTGLFVPTAFGTPGHVRAWLAQSVEGWAALPGP